MITNQEFDLLYYLYPKHYRIIYDPLTGQMLITSFSIRSKGEDLTVRLDNNGYLCVKLNNKTVTLHELAAEIVFGIRPKNMVINHIDGDKQNNRPWNLEYITPSENTKHAYRIGLHATERHSNYIDGRCVGKNKKQYKKEWYSKNKQEVIAKASARYYSDPEKYKKYAREYYKKRS